MHAVDLDAYVTADQAKAAANKLRPFFEGTGIDIQPFSGLLGPCVLAQAEEGPEYPERQDMLEVVVEILAPLALAAIADMSAGEAVKEH